MILTVSRKKTKILTVSRKSHHPIETLLKGILVEVYAINLYLWNILIFWRRLLLLGLLSKCTHCSSPEKFHKIRLLS